MSATVLHQLPVVLGLSKRTKQDKAMAMAQDKASHVLLRSLRSRCQANKDCADCTAKLTGWASLPHGVFLCINCAQIHRSLGRHIAQVKSFSTGTYLWYDDEIDAMRVMGNKNANALYASPKHGAPTRPDENAAAHAKEQYVRNKYEKCLWVDPKFTLSRSGVSSHIISGTTTTATAATPRVQKKKLTPPKRKGGKGPTSKKAKSKTLDSDLWGDDAGWACTSTATATGSGSGTGAHTRQRAAPTTANLLDATNTSNSAPCLQPTASKPAPLMVPTRCGAELRKSRTTSQDFFAEFGL